MNQQSIFTRMQNNSILSVNLNIENIKNTFKGIIIKHYIRLK